MITIPRQKNDSKKDIEELLLLSSYPRNEHDSEARENFLNRLEHVNQNLQLQFLKTFLRWILKKHFVILLDFYMEGNVISSKQIKTTYNDTI